ncbi:hypothetical protein PIB30_029141 [Stylosanthes scabra]|uniref:Uncharacterized protein n=1 Tax=Stylosanthes scabra TaxID=79078 RepID=A0ABU6WET4_9FABA|nr:hypothetical protein [Stylosanthes scabra]
MATSFLHLMLTANNNHEDQQQPIIMDNNNNPLLISTTVSSEETTRNTMRSSGRNNNKGSSSSRVKPKKPPQRGLGVEQLERLRMQECWKNMIIINDSSSSSSSGLALPTTTTTTDYYHHYPNMVAFSGNDNGGAVTTRSHVHGAAGFHFIPHHQQQVLHGSAVAHFMGTNRSGVSCSSSSFGSVAMAPLLNPLIGTPFVETSRSELSSIPNLKKTRFNNEESNARKENPLIIWNNNGPNFVGYEAPNIDGEAAAVDEGVEVVAVHRKGNSVCGRVFMEYEFFPGKHAPEPSPIITAPPPTTTPYTKVPPPSNSNSNIDLSLKLSR